MDNWYPPFPSDSPDSSPPDFTQPFPTFQHDFPHFLLHGSCCSQGVSPPKLVMPSNIGNQNGDDLPDIHGGSKYQGAKLLDLRVNAPPSKASSRSKISTINFVDGCWEVFQATCVFPPGFHGKKESGWKWEFEKGVKTNIRDGPL